MPAGLFGERALADVIETYEAKRWPSGKVAGGKASGKVAGGKGRSRRVSASARRDDNVGCPMLSSAGLEARMSTVLLPSTIVDATSLSGLSRINHLKHDLLH